MNYEAVDIYGSVLEDFIDNTVNISFSTLFFF